MKWATTALAVVAFLVGGIGYLHTPSGRKLPFAAKLMGWIGIQCPIDRNASAELIEKGRQKGLSVLRGTRLAAARPALGLELDRSTEADALEWARSRGMNCSSELRGVRYLKCLDVPPRLIGQTEGRHPIDRVMLAFDRQGHLVSIDTFRRKLDAGEAESLLRAISSKLTQALGKPTEQGGELSARYLATGGMSTTFLHYRFSDYIAMLTATRLPWDSGIVLHEQYMSASANPKAGEISKARH